MAFIKKILKNDHREVIVKLVGNGTETITLESLVTPDGRQVIIGTPEVHIVGMQISQIDGPTDVVKITRNSEDAFTIHGNFDFQADGVIQAVINENASFPIVVSNSPTSNSATIILRLRKITGTTGYTGPFHNEPQQ